MECEAVSGKYSDLMFRSMAGGCTVSLVVISFTAPFSGGGNLPWNVCIDVLYNFS
jgi:hypothetical protein